MEAENKKCQNCTKDFKIEPDDFGFYEKMKVPPPTFCPTCRMKRRFVWRNERTLYKRKSDFSGQEIMTMYSPESGIKVYEREIWLGDKWDPMDYGMEYDFSKPFFAQFLELMKKVPLKNLNIINGVNSPYVNNAGDPKNSYLVFNGSSYEDCMYGHGVNLCKSCVDFSHVTKCENCYESFWLTQCANSSFSSECENSFNMILSKNCIGCQDCFGCVNLRKKSYCIFNEQYGREEYFEKVKSFYLGSHKGLAEIKKKVFEFWMKFPNKFLQGTQNVNVGGNYIYHSKDVKNSFLVRDSQNIHYSQYIQELPGSKDCWDFSIWGENSELVYESHSCGTGIQNLKFCVLCQENVHDLEYCLFCLKGAENLFGCIGLRQKQYCILNKQYSKEEYIKMIEKIKKQMDEMPYIDKKGRVYKYGEFFPDELSPHGYNETLAQEFFPLSQDEALAEGAKWVEPAERNYKIDFEINSLPDDIKDVKDDIVGKVIACEHDGKCNQLCTTAFKIILDELTFYRKMNLPLPRLCPNCRTFERLKQRAGIELYQRKCMKEGCGNEFETTYAPERPEIIYCEKCYQSEVY